MNGKKYKNKYLTLVMSMIAMIVGIATTVSAAAADKVVMGVPIIWIGAIIIFIGILMWLFIAMAKKNPKTFLALFMGGLIFVALGASVIVFIGAEDVEPASIMPPGVSWKVGETPTVTGGNATVGDGIITCRFGTNATAGTLTYPVTYAAGDTEVNWVVPTVNFSLRIQDTRPAVIGAADTVYSSTARSSHAEQITVAGTNYNFFNKTAGIFQKNEIAWTFDGNTEYEEIDIQLTGGSTGYITVELNPNRAGFSQLDVYTSKSMTLNIAGSVWTIVFENVFDNDNS